MLNQAPWPECGSCHRWFRGDACYESYCRPNKPGESVCKKCYKCLQCQKVLTRHRRKPEDHQCGDVMCSTCQEFVDPNYHLCYIQPIESESEKQRKKRNNREGKEESEEEQEYLFFDIESQQDQCRHIRMVLWPIPFT